MVGGSGASPVVPSRGALRPLGLREVRIAGGFWGERQRVNGTASLEHCRTWMDKVGWTGNFAIDDGVGPVEHRGREFVDSEVYKLIEAMSWETGRPGGEDHEAELAELIAMVAAVQQPDGYLNTAYGRPGQGARYSDLNFGHELYCLGHLLQAAVARGRTSADPTLVRVARRAADHVCEAFETEGFCGHPEIEVALVELYRLTGERRYLDQAARFVERRGHRTLPEHEFGWAYFLDDMPVRDATVLRGHAVRALYLACGAVDVAVETGDDALLATVARQFDRTLARRTYLTGGVGSRHLDESFGDDFVLPSDRAYSETCAGVATVMLAWRLLLATGESRYADVIERVLYNVIATAVADDGRAFFYAHTLHQRVPTEPPAPDKEQLRFGGGPRAPWFEVSCCLPNVARLLAGLATYLVTEDDGGVQVHQYASCDVETSRLSFQLRTNYPDDGDVLIRITASDGKPCTLSLRVPAWAAGATIEGEVTDRVFRPGDEIRLRLPMRPRWTVADPRIDAVRGCAAVELGPLVLCAESTDQVDPDLDRLRVDPSVAVNATPVSVSGGFVAPTDEPWPYRTAFEDPPATVGGVPLIPYHRWARRGSSTMRVWLPTAGH